MFQLSVKNILHKTFFLVFILWSFLIWQQSVLANTGDLIITIRINDLHGGVYTYDSTLTSTDFGLIVTWNQPSDQYFPPSGILTQEVEEGLIELELQCTGICTEYLDFTDTKNTLTKTKLTIEANKKNYLDFIVKPKEINAVSKLISPPTSETWTLSNSNLLTFSWKMLEKSQKMVDWVLWIHDSGFYSQSINNIYKKVINVVNWFIIIALLIVAFAWNFSFWISTKNLRKTLFFVAIISIVINFTLPFGRLLIDLAETVQWSFLTKTNGERITANDLIAIDLESNWIGKVQNSWTPLDLPDETEWIIQTSDFFTDFPNEQASQWVELTPKGNTYLDATDCTPANRNNCIGTIDCTLLYLPDYCTVGETKVVATCDNQYSDSRWVWFKLQCQNKNQ